MKEFSFMGVIFVRPHPIPPRKRRGSWGGGRLMLLENIPRKLNSFCEPDNDY